MAFNLEVTMTIVRIVVLLIIQISIIRDFLRLRYNTLRFLMIAIWLLILSELPNLAPVSVDNADEFSLILGRAAISTLALTLSFFFFLLFFRAFKTENVLEGRTFIFYSIILIQASIFLPNGLYMRIIIEDNLVNSTSAAQFNPTPLQATIILVNAIMFLISILFLLFLGFQIYREVKAKIKDFQNPEIVNILKRMRWGLVIILISPLVEVFINPLGQVLGPSLSIVGLIIVFFYYRKGGIFLLQGESLKRLIIMNKQGIPVYSYAFHQFKGNEGSSINKMSKEDQEVLFGGALKSIFTLLTEFTGSTQIVEEIGLSDTKILINNTEKDFLVILFIDHVTTFYQEALEKFSNSVEDLLKDIKDSHAFNTNEIKIANNMVEQNFGFGYYQQVGSDINT